MDEGLIKLRIKFTPNSNLPKHVAPYYAENDYTLLYYQFVKGAFGLSHALLPERDVRVVLRFDEIPK